MHQVTLKKTVDEQTLKLPCGDYLMTDALAAATLAAGLSALNAPECHTGPVTKDTMRREESLIFMTPGAYGDILFLTPVLQALHERWPGKLLKVSCFEEYRDALAGVPFVDWVPYPLSCELTGSYTHVVDLFNAIVDRPQMHAVDALAEAIGYQWRDGDSKECVYSVSKQGRIRAGIKYPRIEGRPRLGVQPRTTSPNRDYPGHLLCQVLEQLLDGGWDIFLFGSAGQVPLPTTLAKFITNLTAEDPAPKFAQSAAILTTCDVVLAPDSAICHLAGALHIPTVALYGPFDRVTRTDYAPTVRALQGRAVCSPCNFHPSPGRIWPDTVKGRIPPCRYSNKCEALAELPPGRIVREVEAALNTDEEVQS